MKKIGILLGLFAFAQANAQSAVPGQNLFPQIQQIFNNSQHGCMQCHGAGSKAPLPTTEAGFFNVGSTWVSEARDPATSMIFTKMRGNPGGIMPPTNQASLTPLSPQELALMAQWIRLGPVYNVNAVCTQRAVDMETFMNSLDDDVQRNSLKMATSVSQGTGTGVNVDVSYNDTTGAAQFTDHVNMELIDVTLVPNQTQKRCVVSSLQKQ